PRAALGRAKGANAPGERLFRGDAARSRRGLRGEHAVPLAGDEALVRVSVAEEQHESVAFEAGAEPDACGAEPHEGHVAAIVRACDARSAGAREEQPALRRREDRVAVGLLHELRGLGVLAAHLPERLVRHLDQLRAPFGEIRVVTVGARAGPRVSVFALDRYLVVAIRRLSRGRARAERCNRDDHQGALYSRRHDEPLLASTCRLEDARGVPKRAPARSIARLRKARRRAPTLRADP